MLIILGCCYIQSVLFCYVLQEDSMRNSRQCCSSLLHPSGWRELSVRTPICIQKLWTVIGCIRPDVSATRPDALQCSTSKMISFQNTDMERQLQLFGRCSVPVRMLSLIRQVIHKTFNHSNVRLHCPDAHALIWKLRATEVQPSGSPIQERIFSDFGKSIAQLSVRMPSATFWTPPRKIVSDSIFVFCSL